MDLDQWGSETSHPARMMPNMGVQDVVQVITSGVKSWKGFSDLEGGAKANLTCPDCIHDTSAFCPNQDSYGVS